MAEARQVKNRIVQAVLRECQKLKEKDDLTDELEHVRDIKNKKERLIKSVALASEASRRTINIEPYPVQILASIKMYQGHVIEMKTGEGKTFVSPMTAFAKVLDGQKVHVLTVNDYLVERDYTLLLPVYEMLGLSVGYITTETPIEERKKAYKCDVCYITNSEVGFDYLKDHLAMHPDSVVCNGKYDFAIIDEADSILIDEARTPLIISADTELISGFCISCAKFVKTLELSKETEELEDTVYVGEFPNVDGDAILNLKYGQVYLTENGVKKAEDYFNVIDKAIIENGFEYIFLATDDSRKLELFIKRYNDKLIYFKDVHRSDGIVNVTFEKNDREHNNYLNGLECLRDIYTMSYCNGLVAGLSQVSVCARIVNRSLDKKFEFEKIIDNGIYRS